MAENFKSWLQAEHDAIMGCEKEAIQSMKAGDIKNYTQKMREKAARLADLAHKALPMLNDLPEAQAREIHAKLERFSSSAKMSQQLDSVWFMSALLYNDDHKPGQPDNLDVFIKELN